MNVLFLSTKSPYPLINGHSLRTYHTLRDAARRHDVTLVTFIQQPEHELKPEHIEHLKSFCKEVHTFPIPVDQSRAKLAFSLGCNLFSDLPFVASKYDSPAMRAKIREIIANNKIDLVHVDLLPLSVYLSEFFHLPKILVNHNVESIRLQRWAESDPSTLKRAFLKLQWQRLCRFEKEMVNRFDRCIAVSELDRDVLVGMGITIPISVVPNGTNTEFFKPIGRPPVENSVLWLGHMDVHTNRDAVLYFWREICPLIRQRQPDATMIFVGTAPPREIAEAAASDPRVRVTGFVDDIRTYVDEARVVVVPIRIGSGTRLKILDAMGMGKAIVSTSVGCEGLAVEHGRNILVADTPEAFADEVMSVLANRDLREALERNARECALTYDWGRLCEEQERTYQAAAGGT
ncbi:glycosyl transferase group 1 [Geobacter metallireducens RCH3]|uniref:Glycosyltransferase n=1 Tax=Geobacter metallireducens (strain ATCC 53774 / DSM 7210 / GS-15) TaxID=269799 RepID=Q39U45_GEOMG|nr:glycosyltransferase family 4 protein [Geobacter metallireducens]ABB32229.1 glycosyltransferase [Geobacter metallireducens GS-15]EHP87003.1 glycosyl transferase group 1 [Geobacter metallireducens RCH3]